jgi:glycosyl transferase, family 25
MQARMDSMGLKCSFFEAVDGHAMNAIERPEYDGERRRKYFGRDMSNGEIGCLLSHRMVYQKMVDEHIEVALILEDDVHFKLEFPEILQQILAQDLTWDIVRFLDWPKIYKSPHHKIADLGAGYSLERVQATSGGAYAYMMTRKAAQTLLGHTQKNWLPIDMMHSRIWQTGQDVFVVNPSPVRADFDIASTIGDSRFNKNNVSVHGIEKLKYRLNRAWLKITDGLNKRRAYTQMKKKDDAAL